MRVLVDSSIWIDLLRRKPTVIVEPEDFSRFVVCPPIIQELLQGIPAPQQHSRFRRRLLAFRQVGNPMELEDYLSAADIFRTGRRLGLTIRSSVDCLIAALAIRHELPVWHQDRDFEAIATFTDLRESRGELPPQHLA